jgi:parallel beta-helix repeat protein
MIQALPGGRIVKKEKRSASRAIGAASAALVMAATMIAAAGTLSCTAGVIADVKKEVEEAKQSDAPRVATFHLQSPLDIVPYTQTTSVPFSISVSGSALSYLVKTGASAPSATEAAVDNQCSGWISIASGVTVDAAFSLPAVDGSYTLSAWAKNGSGLVSTTVVTKAVTLDTVAPTISVFTTEDTTVTSPSVSFTLSGSDANAITSWLVRESATAPSTPTLTDAAWTATATAPTSSPLSAGSGTKYVYAWARDAAGNIGSAASPINVVYFDSGNDPAISNFSVSSSTGAQAGYTNTTSLPYSVTAGSYATYYLIKVGTAAPTATEAESTGVSTGWIAIGAGTSTSGTFTLPSTNALYNLTAWGKNAYGQVSSSGYGASITLDTVAPTISTFTRTSAATVTTASVSFTLSGSDANAITSWLVRESATAPSTPTLTDAAWTATATAPTSSPLSAGSGTKYVYAWARDAAGNIGSAASPINVVYFDSGNDPAISNFSVSSSTGAQAGYTNTTSLPYSVTAGSYATYYLIKVGTAAPTATEAESTGVSTGWIAIGAGTSTSGTFTLPSTNALYNLTAWGKNAYGQVSSSGYAASITLDTVAPALDGIALAGTSTTPTSTPLISIAITPSAASTDINGWIVSDTLGSVSLASSWEAAQPTSYSLSSGDGDKTVRAWAKDRAGNIGASVSLAVYLHTAAITAQTVGTVDGSTFRSFALNMIAADEPIYIQYSEPMDPASLVLGGTLNGGTASWPTTSILKLSAPVSDYWPVGAGQTLTVDCACAHGKAAPTVNVSCEVFYGACVGTTYTGSNGYAQAPYNTIPAAITKAATFVSKGLAEVRIATGEYTTNWASSTNRITMVEKVSLVGAYSADWSERTSKSASGNTLRVKIQDLSSTGGASASDPNRAINCPSGLTAANTRIEGLAVYGATNLSATISYGAAISCSSSSLTIRDCEIVAGGGAASDNWRYGIYLYSSSPTIEGNDINQGGEGGGSATYMCYGIYLDTSCSPIIRGNRISGGTADGTTGWAIAIQAGASTANPTVEANTIDGGTAAYTAGFISQSGSGTNAQVRNNLFLGGAAAGSYSYGLYLLGACPPIVRNNTILCRNTATSGYAYGVYLGASGAKPTLQNNIFLFPSSGTRTCFGIYENATMVLTAVQNNDFYYFDATYHILYYNYGSGNVTTITALNELEDATNVDYYKANLGDDPELDASTSAPTASNTVTVGGIDGAAASWGFTTDKNGDLRTGSSGTGWSIGCYEKD